jgi:glycosyltransferase involved in cell wall biosynthesis
MGSGLDFFLLLFYYPGMRICLISDAYYPSIGGIETCIQAISEQFANAGNKVFILTHYPLKDKERLVPDNLHPDIEIIRIKAKAISLYGSDPVIDPFVTSKVYHVLKDLNCDIAHGQGLFSLLVFSGLKVAKSLGIPTVITEQSSINQIKLLSPITRIYTSIIPYYIESICDAMTGVSKPCINQIRPLKIPTYIVGNGADSRFDIFSDEKKKEIRLNLGFSSDNVVIGFFGRLVKRKGIIQLLDMLPEIEKRVPNIKLLIIGGGPLESYVKNCISKSKEGTIVYLGKKKAEEMPEYFQAIDIFAFPTYGEGLPIVVLEALSSGVPVVAFPSAGIPEVITSGREGFLVKSNDECLEKIVFLANNKGIREEMGRRGNSLINKKFRWKHISEELLEIYKKLVD